MIQKRLRKAYSFLKIVAAFFLPIILAATICSSSVSAQVLGAVLRETHPSYEYDRAWDDFSDGNFERAMEDFQKILKKRQQNRRITLDQICYFTMIGECLYQLGRYQDALAAYDEAINILLENYDWAAYLRDPGQINALDRQVSPWGPTNRRSLLGGFPKSYHIRVAVGTDLYQYGNYYEAESRYEYWPINAREIFRCIALAIRHRAEILGPMSKFDRKNDELVEKLESRPALPNHWTAFWIDVHFGLALSAAGRDEEAFAVLKTASEMPGRFDHPLTGITLCEMGRIKLRSGAVKEAAGLFYEASIAAYDYWDLITLEECFRYGAITQRLINRRKPCEYLVNAINHAESVWNNRKRNTCANPIVMCSLYLEIADDFLSRGNLSSAKKSLAAADGIMKGRAFANGRFAARWYYLDAWGAYISGDPKNLPGGDKSLALSMQNLQQSSLWISQVRLLSLLHKSGSISTTGPITMRKAIELYDYLLREPTAADWIMQPMDSLAVQLSVPPETYELWFYAACNLDYSEKAFEISEQVRRKRFFAMDPFGSRLISFRAMFAAPPAILEPSHRLERQQLGSSFPAFARLSNRSNMIRMKLRTLPSVPENEEQEKEMNSLFSELEKASMQQELMLRSIALSRTRSPSVFPPRLPLNEIRERLPEGTTMLVFFAARGNMYAFMVDRNNFEMWKVPANINQLRETIGLYLAALGNNGPTKEIPVKDLREEVKRTESEAKKLEWKQRGSNILRGLLGGMKQADFTELVIVPDHVLWYLPFETLCNRDPDGQLRPLIAARNETLKIRCVPTASLGVPSKFGRASDVETLLVAGKLFSKDSTEKAEKKVVEFKQEIDRIKAIPIKKIPQWDSLYATQLNRLVVFNDITVPGGPLSWNPFGKPARQSSSLASWLSLPWGGPQLIVLPGFHTPAENGRKLNGDGSELFYSALTMQANGAQSILISRWNPGGDTSYELVKDFLKNYQEFPAAESWKKAVLNIANRSLSFSEEPRVRAGKNEEPLKANHPFFWGAFLLIDRGELPAEEGEEPGIEEEPSPGPIPEEEAGENGENVENTVKGEGEEETEIIEPTAEPAREDRPKS